MYKVNEELYINLEMVATLYRSERNNAWRLVMVGATEYEEYSLTDIEVKNILSAMELYKGVKK